ncbi:outer membrane beta-barrel protein [Nevskia sp.]|uniref:outer membrane beta-barrel protein n=1 Tax=Nevskia sp. TaxID=1929292 RepID=UPI0025F2AF6B|nr:outer membrane beta-barrel protein [Nevskia sp.]
MTHRVKASPIRIAAAALLAGGALFVIPAQADQGFYLGAIGGVTLDPDANVRFADGEGGTATDRAEFETGPAGSFVAGYTFASGLRPELELGYRRAEVSDSDARTETAQGTASLYYNFSRNGYFFYLGGGGGYAQVRLDAGLFGEDDDGTPVYSVGTGFGIPVGKRLMLGVDYRYVGAFDRTNYNYAVEDLTLAGSFKYQSHFVGLSLRVSFGSALADSHPVQRPVQPVKVVPVSN